MSTHTTTRYLFILKFVASAEWSHHLLLYYFAIDCSLINHLRVLSGLANWNNKENRWVASMSVGMEYI